MDWVQTTELRIGQGHRGSQRATATATVYYRELRSTAQARGGAAACKWL